MLKRYSLHLESKANKLKPKAKARLTQRAKIKRQEAQAKQDYLQTLLKSKEPFMYEREKELFIQDSKQNLNQVTSKEIDNGKYSNGNNNNFDTSSSNNDRQKMGTNRDFGRRNNGDESTEMGRLRAGEEKQAGDSEATKREYITTVIDGAVAEEFKIAARYALSKKFNDLVIGSGGFVEPSVVQEIMAINFEARAIDVKLDKSQANKIFAKKIEQNINRLAYSLEVQQADVLMELFDYVEKLELEIDISEAQNTYFTRIYHRIGEIIELSKKSKRTSERRFAQMLLDIGDKLNINTDFYRSMLDKAGV